MNVKLIGKHEKDSRACRDGLALTLDEMMAQDKSICYVDCDLMGCINTGNFFASNWVAGHKRTHIVFEYTLRCLDDITFG